MQVIPVALILAGFLIALLSWNRCRKKQFYSDTLGLIPLGIYVWGDGLVLGPFWLMVGLIFWFLELRQMLLFMLIFWVIRSAFEVIYWLNHQSVKESYCPPFFRRVTWLDATQSAILYQLVHTCVVVLGLTGICILGK